ncbi:MAG: maleylpyruvate isomerase N-terminal domain-containing protein, partial [Acidimicrobiaceae bacterium]|nr:maleylpyruvate isomerase N-terminal domain-containing protein [Acidimicrobiaceae bacterium]
MTVRAAASVIDDLERQHRAIETLVTDAELDAGTLAAGWTVRDTIEHLLISDWLALLAVADPSSRAPRRQRRR